jgi:hypothetical protein
MSDDDELVIVAEATNEAEASVIVGFLESRGIRATYERRGELGSPFPVAGGGHHEVFVRAADAEAAQAALAEAEPSA